MSFSDKISALMARPGQDPNPKEDVPWWFRYGGRALGTVGSIIAIFFGLSNCLGIITFNTGCLVAGIWQMIAGFLVLCCEAPCCCMFIDYVQNMSDWVDRRPHWNKAIAYVVLAIPAIIMCRTVSSVLGSGLIFATGVVYGMMALGKKATAEEMRSNAAADNAAATPQTQPNTNMRSNLVANAQPISFTGAPVFDSNV